MNSSPGEQWWMRQAMGPTVARFRQRKVLKEKQETIEFNAVRKVETGVSGGSMSSTVYSVTCLLVIQYPRKTI